MTQKISLKEVENQIFKSSYQDGLMDIFIGSIVLMFAIAPWLTPHLGDFWGTAIFVPFWAVVFAVLWAIRKYVVKPRVGVFEYNPWRRQRMVRFSLVMAAVFSVTFVLGLLSAIKFEAIPGWMHSARFALVVLVTFSALAYFLDLARLYVYGMLIALAFLAGEVLWVTLGVPHHGYPVTFGLVSLIIMGNGLYLLLKLLREHPLEAMPLESGEIGE